MFFYELTPTGRERSRSASLHVSEYTEPRVCYDSSGSLLILRIGNQRVFLTRKDVDYLFNLYHRQRIVQEQYEIRGIDAIRKYEDAKRECFSTLNNILGGNYLKL